MKAETSEEYGDSPMRKEYSTGSITWIKCDFKGCHTELVKSSGNRRCEKHRPDEDDQNSLGDFQ